MKNRIYFIIISVSIAIALSNAAFAQDLIRYDTEYFTIGMPTNCEVMTRLEFDRGLYENDPILRAGAYTENAISFVTLDSLELTCSNLKGLYSIMIQVYDANEDYVTTGREESRILPQYDKLFDAMEQKDSTMTISRAKSFRTDGANYIYVDVVSPFYNYDKYDRDYYFTFPWKGTVKMFHFTISSIEESLDVQHIAIAEACLKSLSIKH